MLQVGFALHAQLPTGHCLGLMCPRYLLSNVTVVEDDGSSACFLPFEHDTYTDALSGMLVWYYCMSHPVTNPLPRTHALCMFDVSSLVTPHVDKDTLYPTSCWMHVL
jgi:hypothetical protein